MKREVPTSPDLLDKIFSGISDGAILVGGQALAYWVGKYDINLSDTAFIGGGAISSDTDFLGTRADVTKIAAATSGKTQFIPKERISALVGLVQIAVGNDEYVNVDVLHKLYKVDVEKVRSRASEVIIGKRTLLVMSPLDILESRVENLAGLADKQNDEGIDQTVLAIKVANAFIQDIAAEHPKAALKAIEEVVSIAKSGAGQRVISRYDVNFLMAIPAQVIDNENFKKLRWPQIQKELSEDKAVTAAMAFVNTHEYQLKYANFCNGHYQGKIVYTNVSIAIQHVGQNHVISHSTGTWPERPKVGDSVTIRYRNGEVDIQPKLQTKDRGLSI